MTSHGADGKGKINVLCGNRVGNVIGCRDQNGLNHGRNSLTSKLVVIAARRRAPKRITTETGALASLTGYHRARTLMPAIPELQKNGRSRVEHGFYQSGSRDLSGLRLEAGLRRVALYVFD